MGLRNLLRRAKRQEQRHGVMVPSQPLEAANPLPQVHKMTLSQETLDELIKGRDSLMRQRQQLVQQIQQVDAYIQQQQGGIETMQQLLASQEEANPLQEIDQQAQP